MLAGVWGSTWFVSREMDLSWGGYLVPYLAVLVALFAFLSGGVFPILLKLSSASGYNLPRQTGTCITRAIVRQSGRTLSHGHHQSSSHSPKAVWVSLS